MSVKQADLATQKEHQSLASHRLTPVALSTGKVCKVPYTLPCAQDKVNSLIVEYEGLKKDENSDELTLNNYTRRFYAKCVAALVTRNPLKILLGWPWAIHWRWLYYFSGWNGEDYANVIMEAKKKAQEEQYSVAMVLLMDMMTTTTMMGKKEAEEYRRELESVRKARSLKNSQD